MYRKNAGYGWKPDLPDHRDLKYSANKESLVELPLKIDLTSNCPPVYDQGQLGSCTANAIAAAYEFELMKQSAPLFLPSRLFIYFNERSIENSINSDSGAQIRDGFKSIGNLGVCPEEMWPYIESEFAQKPFSNCYQDAINHTGTYHSVNRDITEMKGCLAEGYPFVFGFTVYESFEGRQIAQSGVLNMPQPSEKQVGGHAVLAVGYDDSSQRFIVRNSWGANWGISGYFTIPYDYLLDTSYSDDFWTIRLVTNNVALSKTTD